MVCNVVGAFVLVVCALFVVVVMSRRRSSSSSSCRRGAARVVVNNTFFFGTAAVMMFVRLLLSCTFVFLFLTAISDFDQRGGGGARHDDVLVNKVVRVALAESPCGIADGIECGQTSSECSCNPNTCTNNCCVSKQAVRNACAVQPQEVRSGQCQQASSPCLAFRGASESELIEQDLDDNIAFASAKLVCIDGKTHAEINLGASAAEKKRIKQSGKTDKQTVNDLIRTARLASNGYSAFVPTTDGPTNDVEAFIMKLKDTSVAQFWCRPMCRKCRKRIDKLREQFQTFSSVEDILVKSCETDICDICKPRPARGGGYKGFSKVWPTQPVFVDVLEAVAKDLPIKDASITTNTVILYRSRTRGSTSVFISDCNSRVTLSLGPDATEAENRVEVALPFFFNQPPKQNSLRRRRSGGKVVKSVSFRTATDKMIVSFDDDKSPCSEKGDDYKWHYQLLKVRRADPRQGIKYRQPTDGPVGDDEPPVNSCTPSPVLASRKERRLLDDVNLGRAKEPPQNPDNLPINGGSPLKCRDDVFDITLNPGGRGSSNSCVNRTVDTIEYKPFDFTRFQPSSTFQWIGNIVAYNPAARGGFGVRDSTGSLNFCAAIGPPAGGFNVISLGRSDLDETVEAPSFAVNANWQQRIDDGGVPRGCIVGEFTNVVVVDGPGNDLCISENPFCVFASDCDSTCGARAVGACDDPSDPNRGCPGVPVFAEPGMVSVSEDGDAWVMLNEECTMRTQEETPEACQALWPGCAGVTPSTSDALRDCDGRCGGNGDCFDLADVGVRYVRYVRVCDVGGVNTIDSGTNAGFDMDAACAINYRVPDPPVDV